MVAATATSTWASGISADWSVAADWSPTGVPNTSATAVLIDAAPSGAATYTVGLAKDETFAAQGVTLNNPNATLNIAGRLNLNTGTLGVQQGTITLNSGTINNASSLTGVLTGAGSITGATTLVNAGTILNDTGNLFILDPFVNNGTVATTGAGGAFLGIEGLSFSNLSSSTLTGGSYISQGFGTAFNILGIAVGSISRIVTNAATLVLDGRASDIRGFNNGTFESISSELLTIASTGALQLLSARGFTTTNPLTDAGLLRMDGGTLSTGGLIVSGTLQAFGIVNGPLVGAGGTILVNTGALDLNSAVSGSAALVVNSGATLITEGATATTVVDNGVLYSSAGTLNIGTLSGSGTLVVENGSTVDIASASNQSLIFGGSNAVLRLGSPLSFTGTLGGFGGADGFFAADQLILGGIKADSAAVVNGTTLAIMSSGATIDTIALSGVYTGATFSTTISGNDTIIKNLTGAPARNGLSATINLTDNAGLSTTQENEVIANLQAAVGDWGAYVTGHAPLRISLTIANTTNGAALATAGFTGSILSGQTISGYSVIMPSSIYALTTGNYVSGLTADIDVTVYAGGTNLNQLYINPTPATLGAVPSDKYDLRTIFRHELAHGLGFSGLTDEPSGVLSGANASLYDTFIQSVLNGGTVTSGVFTGSHAQAAYATLIGTNVATPVPLTALNNGENLFHVANLNTDPLANDLMNGLGLSTGSTLAISGVDLAMLRDVGLPVTAGIVCFAAGTRIATPDGAMAVDDMQPGQPVLTASGETRPAIWIGRRTIDCRRHPAPEIVWPVRIRAHAFGDNLPARDLSVSPNHALYLDSVLIPARLLIDGDAVAQIPTDRIEYLHIELADHDILLAEGLPAESYLDCGDRSLFANAPGPVTLHPDMTARAWAYRGCAELCLVGPEIDAIRLRLSVRARQRQVRAA